MSITKVSHVQVVVRGAKRVGSFGWDLLLTTSPFAPVMLFYQVAPVLIVYLHSLSPASAAGFDAIGHASGLPWWGIVLIFIVCAVLGFQFKSPQVRSLLVWPMLLYAGLLAKLTLDGVFSAGSAFSILFLITCGWMGLALLRYYQEMATAKNAIKALEVQVADLKKSLPHAD